MRIKFLAVSFSILLAQAPATAAPAPPPLLTPTGPWNVEFADSMCLLSRPYGKNGATSLFLKPAMLGDGLEIIVTEATTSIADAEDGKADLSIAGKKADVEALFRAYSTAKTRLLRINLKEDKIALSAVRGTLAIDAKPENRYLFSLAGIERALPVLTACVDQLRAIYKVSASDMADIVTMPEAKISFFFSTNDYPTEAWSKRQTGTVGVLVWVEPIGRISTCTIIESSATPPLEFATCDILKRRAKFTPAKDAAGKAIRAPSFARIRWMLPTD